MNKVVGWKGARGQERTGEGGIGGDVVVAVGAETAELGDKEVELKRGRGCSVQDIVAGVGGQAAEEEVAEMGHSVSIGRLARIGKRKAAKEEMGVVRRKLVQCCLSGAVVVVGRSGLEEEEVEGGRQTFL